MVSVDFVDLFPRFICGWCAKLSVLCACLLPQVCRMGDRGLLLLISQSTNLGFQLRQSRMNMSMTHLPCMNLLADSTQLPTPREAQAHRLRTKSNTVGRSALSPPERARDTFRTFSLIRLDRLQFYRAGKEKEPCQRNRVQWAMETVPWTMVCNGTFPTWTGQVLLMPCRTLTGSESGQKQTESPSDFSRPRLIWSACESKAT